MGLDTNYLTKSGFSYLSHSKGALFIGTNPDKNIPTKEAYYGAGSVVTFVETATQTKPGLYWQTKSAIIMERAIAHLGVEKSEIIMVGR